MASLRPAAVATREPGEWRGVRGVLPVPTVVIVHLGGSALCVGDVADDLTGDTFAAASRGRCRCFLGEHDGAAGGPWLYTIAADQLDPLDLRTREADDRAARRPRNRDRARRLALGRGTKLDETTICRDRTASGPSSRRW